MKVRAVFSEHGLELVLLPETDAERRMVGAVLGVPQEDPNESCFGAQPKPVASELIRCERKFSGHWYNNAITELRLSIDRKQPEPRDE